MNQTCGCDVMECFVASYDCVADQALGLKSLTPCRLEVVLYTDRWSTGPVVPTPKHPTVGGSTSSHAQSTIPLGVKPDHDEMDQVNSSHAPLTMRSEVKPGPDEVDQASVMLHSP